MMDAKRKVNGKIKGIQDGTPLGNALIIAITLFVLLITVYPVYYVLIMSLSDTHNAVAMNVYFWPKGFNITSYQVIAGNPDMWRSYGYTIFYVVTTTVLMLTTCTLAAYPLTVPGLFGRRVLVIVFLLTPMYFSGGLIPFYMLMTKMGLYNNVWALIVPGSYSLFNIILMRTYFYSLPPSLRESAFIDGASHWQVMTQLYMPISTPIYAVIAIYTIVGVWNSWFNAMVFMPDITKQPLQMYLRRVIVDQAVDLNTVITPEMAKQIAMQKLASIQIRYAMIIFTTLPILFTYPFFQKYFVKGVMVGSLKE